MEETNLIIQKKREIIQQIKEYLDIVTLQFLKDHLYVKEKRGWTHQEKPEPWVDKGIFLDSYAMNILNKYNYEGFLRGYAIGSIVFNDNYLYSLQYDKNIDSLDECKKMALSSYDRDKHMSYLVGTYCLSSFWGLNLPDEEKNKVEEAIISDLREILNLNIKSLKYFSVEIDSIKYSCEVVSGKKVKLTKLENVFGDCITYNDNRSCISSSKVIDIPFTITWMDNSFDVCDIANGFFDNCNETETVIIPNDLLSFNWSFWNCHNLKEIKVKVRNKFTNPDQQVMASFDGVLYRCIRNSIYYEYELVAYPNNHGKVYHIPEKSGPEDSCKIKIVSIGKFAFKDCSSIETLYIPDTVKHIGCNAFYRCNNLRIVYYHGFLEDLKNEGFIGDYGSVNPIWLCKTRIPAFQPKVSFTYSEDSTGKAMLHFSVGGVKFNMILIDKYEKAVGRFCSFIGETAVTRALWKIVMSDYPEEQYKELNPVKVTYNQAEEFIEELSRITQMRFYIPTTRLWLKAAKGNQEDIDLKKVEVLSKYPEYQVKSMKTNDLGIYDMWGPGELCNPILYDAAIIGYEVLGKVSEEECKVFRNRGLHPFRLNLICHDLSWRDNIHFKG